MLANFPGARNLPVELPSRLIASRGRDLGGGVSYLSLITPARGEANRGKRMGEKNDDTNWLSHR